MEVETHERDSAIVMLIHGRLDAASSPELDRQLNAVIGADDEARAVVLDFSPAVFISSAGLRVLLAAAKKLQSMRRPFLLCGINADIMEVFKMTGFHRVLQIHQRVDDALGTLA